MNKGTFLIKTANVSERSIVRKKDGRSMTFREQLGALFVGGDFPVPVKIPLDDDQPPYAPGEYVLDPECLIVGDYDRASIGRLKLRANSPAASK